MNNDSDSFLQESTHTIYHHFHLSSHMLGFCSYQHFLKWILFTLVMISVLQSLGLAKNHRSFRLLIQENCAICKNVDFWTRKSNHLLPAWKSFSRSYYIIIMANNQYRNSLNSFKKPDHDFQVNLWYSDKYTAKRTEKISHHSVFLPWWFQVLRFLSLK